MIAGIVLFALGLVAAVCAALIAYEALRYPYARAWIRSRRGAFTMEEAAHIETRIRGGTLIVELDGPRDACEEIHYLWDPLQDDDRNDSRCLLRVVAESREYVAMRLVETIARGSFRDRRCTHLELLRAHLDLGLAMLHQIMVPAGMCRCAALRRRDHVSFTITVVDDRRRAHLAALRPARREEQEVIAPWSDVSSALRVELVNDARVPVRHV